MRVEDDLEVRARRTEPLGGLDPPPARMLFRLELTEARLPDLLFHGDEMPNDLDRRPLTGLVGCELNGCGRSGGGSGRGAKLRREARETVANGGGVGHGRIVGPHGGRCDTRTRERDEEGRMSVVYNQIANRSLERIGALSDGLFAIAMTLIVLEIRVPEL